MPNPIVLVTGVGAATGVKPAAAGLACAASAPDRAALLVDLSGDRAPRPTLIATAGARKLEERLIAQLPDAPVASRGKFCQLSLPAAVASIGRIVAGLPLTRESAAVIHLPPPLLRPLLAELRIRPTAALLRADLATHRALTSLVVSDLIGRGLRVAVLKRPPARLATRLALLGLLPVGGYPLPNRHYQRLLADQNTTFGPLSP